MKVFKFGGASINDAERMKNTAEIIFSNTREKVLVVISAMGKTTNALEKIAETFFTGNKEEALNLFEHVKKSHLAIVKYLLTKNWKACEDQLQQFFTEIEWMLHDKPVRSFDYYYDQIVCCGELFSTCIMARYLEEIGSDAAWIDVRDIVRTDNNFRDANVDFAFTSERIHAVIEPLFEKNDIIITQGFIGSTDENESTTLGREGSDYSAAVFANILQADDLTIWKDVESVMNADPRKFSDAVNIPALSYREVIEMAYYGAQVIHPKTIKPLQNKKIPLYVKSFLNPALPGTIIDEHSSKDLPPIIVLKVDQVMVQFRTLDYSFIEGRPVEQLHEIFKEIRLQPNLSQNTAVSLLCSFDDVPEKIERIATVAAENFDVELERNLSLLTIRHYTPKAITNFTEGKNIVLEQKTPVTMQALMRDS